MSDLPTQEQAQEAASFMAQQVHAPAFFEKLASHDIVPQTQAEVDQLLQLGVVLQQAHNVGQYKTAAAIQDETANPFLKYALDVLQADPPTPQPAANDAALFDVAAKFVQGNGIAKQAALTYAHLVGGGEIAPAKEAAAEPATAAA